MHDYSCDVLVIGGGIAGMFSAIKAREAGASVILIDKGYAGRSGQSPYADSFLIYDPKMGHNLKTCVDWVCRVGEYMNHRGWVETVFLNSLDRFHDLQSYGCKFEEVDGEIHFFPPNEPGLQSRVMFNKRDTAYGDILRRKALSCGVKIIDRTMVGELLKQDGRIVGAIGLPAESLELITIAAKTTILCVGSSGFKPIGYAPLMQDTCDGEAMAYRAGAVITGKEFVDTHFSKDGQADPTGQRDAPLPPAPGSAPKGPPPKFRGGLFGRTNAKDELISDRPYGTASYAFTYLQSEFEVHAGNGPIDIRGSLSYGNACLGMSLRKADGLWPADMECRSNVGGLFAAGDALGNLQNGAAYDCAGSSICGGAVTGTIAGQAAAKEASLLPAVILEDAEIARARDYILTPYYREGGFSPAWVTQLLQNTMMPYFVLLIKEEKRLQAALTNVMFMKEHLVPQMKANDSHDLRLALETANMVLSAEMRLRSGLFRKESRGNHYREDYPFRDDENWLAWVTIQENNGSMKLTKIPIPEKYRPSPTLTYSEKYLFPIPGEEKLRYETEE